MATATWVVEGITYRTQKYSEAEIKAAEAAGQKIERLETQNEVMRTGTDIIYDTSKAMEQLTVSTDKGTVSLGEQIQSVNHYIDALKKVGLNTEGMVTATGQPSQAFEDWTYLTQRPEYRASEEYQKAQAEMQRVESELGPEDTFSPIGILVAYAQEWAKRVGATFERGNWQIPEFQSGGIVPSTGLAMVHGGETIIPANEGLSNITIQFTQPVFFDREDTMNKFVDMIRKGIQRQDRLRFGGAYSG